MNDNYPVLYNILDIKGLPTDYYIDDGSNVYKFENGQFNYIKPNINKDGRPKVCIDLGEDRTDYLSYRLLMRASTDMSDEEFSKYDIDHKDCDPSHNTYDNLEIVTHAENMRRAGMNNLMPYGENHHNSKYSDELIEDICKDITNGVPRSVITSKYSVNGQLVDDIRSGRSHTKISSKYVSMGFKYKAYDRTPGALRARDVCDLLSKNYSIQEIMKMTGYPYNFIYPIYKRITYKDISSDYNF